MDLRQLIATIVEQAYAMWRYRLWAVITAWCVAIGGWAWVLTLPNEFDADATVYVNTDTVLAPLLQGLTVSTNKLNQVSLMVQVLLTQPQLKTVAIETGLEGRARTPEELEKLLAGLKTDIQITRLPRQDLFRISYRDYDPKMARDVVQVLLTTFMEKSLRKDRAQAGQAQTFLQQQIKLYEQRLQDSENRLADFKKQNVALLPGAGGNYFQRLKQTESEIEVMSGQIRALQEQRNELIRQLEGEEPVLGMTGGFTGTSTSVDGPIASLEGQLADLRVKVTDKHPDVLRIQQMLRDLYTIRDEERAASTRLPSQSELMNLNANPVYQQLRVSLSNIETELASLRPQLEQKQSTVAYLKRMVDTIPTMEAEMNRLDRDYDVVKRQYDALVQRLESARLSDEVQSDSEQITFDVIEPPRLPLTPAAPNRELLFSVVLGAAIAAGLGVAFLLSQHSPVFYTTQSLQAFTGLPVFGSVGFARAQRFRRQDLVLGASVGVLLLAFFGLLLAGSAGLSALKILPA